MRRPPDAPGASTQQQLWTAPAHLQCSRSFGLGIDTQRPLLSTAARHLFSWLGMLSDAPVKKHATTIDTFCALLAGKLQYQPGERDCAIMQAKALRARPACCFAPP